MLDPIHESFRDRTLRALRLSWVLVRALGELQILTKVSYSVLVVVPLLAGTWPAVRLVVNQQYRVASEMTTTVQETHRAFESSIQEARRAVSSGSTELSLAGPIVRPALDRLAIASDQAADAAEQFAREYAHHASQAVRLPWTFAAAFFAALFVTGGHFLYQLNAPPSVRKWPQHEFIRHAVDEYSSRPTESALTRATGFFDRGRTPQRDYDEASNFLARSYEIRDLREWAKRQPPNKLLRIWATLELERDRRFKERDRNELHNSRQLIEEVLGVSSTGFDLIKIERGSAIEYDLMATSRSPAIAIVIFAYVAAMYLLVLIVKVQSENVADAAGWSSWTDLFFR